MNMDFIILFRLLANLNFNLSFQLSENVTQDFFIFSGRNSYAHLHRVNKDVYLSLSQNNQFERYQARVLDKLHFSWVDFMINGTCMEKIKSTGAVNMTNLNQFIFLSPVLDFQPQISNETEPMQSIKLGNVNYGYIAALMLIFAIAIELKVKIPLIFNKLFRNNPQSRVDNSDYVSMMDIEIDAISSG